VYTTAITTNTATTTPTTTTATTNADGFKGIIGRLSGNVADDF